MSMYAGHKKHLRSFSSVPAKPLDNAQISGAFYDNHKNRGVAATI